VKLLVTCHLEHSIKNEWDMSQSQADSKPAWLKLEVQRLVRNWELLFSPDSGWVKLLYWQLTECLETWNMRLQQQRQLTHCVCDLWFTVTGVTGLWFIIKYHDSRISSLSKVLKFNLDHDSLQQKVSEIASLWQNGSTNPVNYNDWKCCSKGKVKCGGILLS
jgi:hypothetical protein